MDFMHYLRERTASLLTELDKKMLVVLRDGRTLIGYFRSVDQFANLVLEDTIERIHVGKKYGDLQRGIFIIRGENVVLLGEIDPALEDNGVLTKVSVNEILDAQRREMSEKEEQDKRLNKARLERGLPPHMPDMGLDEYQ